MKTKEEIIEEFKESLEKFRINPFLKGHVQAVVEEQYLEFKNLALASILKALEAKDKQCKQEKIELVESAPLDCKAVETYDMGIYTGDCEDQLKEWKEEKLKQLKSNSHE